MRRVLSLSVGSSPSIIARRSTNTSNDRSQQFTTGLEEVYCQIGTSRDSVVVEYDPICHLTRSEAQESCYQVRYHGSSQPNEDCYALK
jgi:hypothetical protein